MTQPEPAKPSHPHDRPDEDDEQPVETDDYWAGEIPSDYSHSCSQREFSQRPVANIFRSL